MLLVVGAIVLLLVAAAAWVGVRALLVKDQLEAIVPIAAELQAAADARDIDRITAALTDLDAHAEQADSLSGDPLWRVAEFTPWLGSNLAAARVVSSGVHGVSDAALPLMAAIRTAIEQPHESAGLDVDALNGIAEPLQQTSLALNEAQTELARIDPGVLVGPLASGVERLADVTAQGAPVLSSLASASQLLPSMLGREGERHVLVMLQNSAELRTGGGITGSFVLLRADNGAVEIVDQADGGSFPAQVEPIAPVPASTVELYGERVGRFVQNTSMPTEFGATAELANAWWATRSDIVPDAVLSVDIPAVRAMLSASEPVMLSDGSELTADNVIQRVLIDPYLSLDVEEQTAYQRELTGSLISGLFSQRIDFFSWAGALAEPIEQGRISLWSSHPDEQELIDAGPLAGPAARHVAAGSDSFAVYLNDATSGKMSSFLGVTLAAGSVECRPDGRSDVVVGVALTNNAPANAGEVFPWWLTGGGLEGVTPGNIAMNVTVAAPPGSFYGGALVDGVRTTTTDVEDEGFPSSAAVTTVAPGQTSVLEFRFVMDTDREVVPRLLHTPLIGVPETATLDASCD